MEERSHTAELTLLAQQCPCPLGAITHDVFRKQLQHGPCPAPAAVAGRVPQDVLSCSMPPGPSFPHPTQTVHARSPGLNLSLGWSTTSMHRDMVPSPASASHPQRLAQFTLPYPGLLTVCSISVPAVFSMASHSACRIWHACLHLQPRAPACSSLCFLPSHLGPLEPGRCLFHPSFSQCCNTTPKMTMGA